MKKVALFFITIFLFFSCQNGTESSSSCSFVEELGNAGSDRFYTIGPGEFVAQRFRLNKKSNLSRVTLNIEFLTATTVKVAIYESLGGRPNEGTLIEETSGGENHVSSKWYHDFNFRNASLMSNRDYYFVISTDSGTFRANSGVPLLADITGEFWHFDGTTWIPYNDHDTLIHVAGSGDC